MSFNVNIEIFPIEEKLPETYKEILIFYGPRYTDFHTGEISTDFECSAGYFDGNNWFVKNDSTDVYSGERYARLSLYERHLEVPLAWCDFPKIPHFNVLSNRKY